MVSGNPGKVGWRKKRKSWKVPQGVERYPLRGTRGPQPDIYLKKRKSGVKTDRTFLQLALGGKGHLRLKWEGKSEMGGGDSRMANIHKKNLRLTTTSGIEKPVGNETVTF